MKKRKMFCLVLVACMLLCLLPTPAVKAADLEGTFSAATLNVDGLPSLINSDGPGASGSTTMGQMIAQKAWDIVAFQEDFEHNTQLMSALGSLYNAGTYRGTVKLGNLISRADTDGLNLLWKKTASATGETFVQWNSSNGNLFNGAEDYLKKGYRYYEVEVAEQVYVDVYIMHMDSGSKSGDITDRESQLTQLANAIKASNTHNPIIVMGDTNARYTREHLETLFIDAINADSRFAASDAWVELVRDGVYPEYGSKALVDDTKGDINPDTDIAVPLPQAEVVDKVIYINNNQSCVTLTADSYTVDTSFVKADGSRLADHFPVVVGFSYEATHEEYDILEGVDPTCEHGGQYTFECTKCHHTVSEVTDAEDHCYEVVSVMEPTCTGNGYIDYVCYFCGGNLREETSPVGHDYVVVTSNYPGCISEGRACYRCNACGDQYWIVTAEPLGHDYVSGQCTRCGEYSEDYVQPDTYNWGLPVASITDGNQYAIVFPSSSPMALSCNTVGALSAVTVETTGAVPENLLWTVRHTAGGYTISTEVNGNVMYLARSNSMANTGYKLTLKSSPFVWTVKMNPDNGAARVTTKVSSSTYTLRYYSTNTGWIVSSKAADILFYSVNG